MPFGLSYVFSLIHTGSHFINFAKWDFGNGQFKSASLVKEIDISQLESFQNYPPPTWFTYFLKLLAPPVISE